ncbi:spore coat protein U domain-containing protein [Usitatibacter palustris]|uniref:Spore coat protein U/FanG domain-containing protein n=1 Tax=Usitatibacter palustris TaxID=2732487 RepID=A0A6M4H5A1_9PROT|nr:spore coat U domain-containing protein [Usitatibacter palustris]QJR14831.1 hypothetical protein DSM104440_01644 [Usitatibacter palustris]
MRPATMKLRALSLAMALCAPALPALAASCSVYSSTLAFGNYDVLSPTPLDSSTDVTILCFRTQNGETVNYTLTLSIGGGTYSMRTMNNGARTIDYNLYNSPAMTPSTIWGNGTSGTSLVSGSLPMTIVIRIATHTIYGRIPAQQDVAIGTYSGSVTLTMNY